ncbi:MAG: hypothetical protein IJS11_06960 [Oscillospiraceae bacterium]|nr:hypothetical protein [Oscillospiraceae bacterium]
MARGDSSYSPRHLHAERSASRGRPAPKDAAARTAAKRGAAARERRAAVTVRKKAPDREPANAELFEKTLLPMVENVHRLDQTSLRVGVSWLLLLPVLLLIIRRLTGSSKITFLIIWVVGTFIISAALILIGYADHQLRRFLEEVKRYEPAAAGTTLDNVLSRDRSDAYALPFPPDTLLGTMQRIRKRLSEETLPEEDGKEESDDGDDAQLLAVEQWLQRLAQRRGKEADHAEHPADYSR